MNGIEFIKSKQQNWVKRRGLKLVSSTISDRGEKNYLYNLTDNLFEELSKKNINSYNSGNGNEIKDCKNRLAKMKAIHSSSGIVVNLFQYWQEKDFYPIISACKLCSKPTQIDIKKNSIGSVLRNDSTRKIDFEVKFEICKDKKLFPYAPNIDVVIKYSQSSIYAIESKFTEPYSKRNKGIKQQYIDNISFWDGLPNIYRLAQEICPNNNKYHYLDVGQLIKHILGLKMSYNKSNFHLLYLWYNVIGKEGIEHRKEIEQFAEIAKRDNIKFSHTTYQETIINLSKKFYDGNEKYCNYLTDRYL